MDNRLLSSELLEEDKNNNIRPETLDEYIGQTEAKENLRIFIKSALMREESLSRRGSSCFVRYSVSA